jgi:hypothetical protein
MALACPRCTAGVDNKASALLLGALGRVVFPKYVCSKCGQLQIAEFPADVQRRINMTRIISGVFFFGILAVVFFLAFLRPH